jgi:hypothetical protein
VNQIVKIVTRDPRREFGQQARQRPEMLPNLGTRETAGGH